MKITGRVWKFGDEINTDLIFPHSAFRASPDEQCRLCMSDNRPGWSEQVQPGDILIAGKNFGTGSSRPGADVLFIEAPQTLEEIRKITETFRGIPLLTNQVIGGKTPRLTAREAHEIGYKIIIYPDVMPFCASVMFRRACDRIMETGQSWDAIPDAHDSRELFMTMGMKDWREKEPLYGASTVEDGKLF